MIEFKPWPKIGRESPFMVTITEKLNGTNACIVIKDGELAGVQSKNRFMTPEDDHYGFAGWVGRHLQDLLKLGDGYHYGEWAGLEIEKNPHNLDKKEFFLFNTFRWNPNNPNKPDCCKVVPILFQGMMDGNTIEDLLHTLKTEAPEEVTPEGLVVYYHSMRKYTKHTIISPKGKWMNK